jgi:lysophospholipase L1-like esterase
LADGKAQVTTATSERRSLRARAWAFYFAHRPLIVLGMAAYLALIHLAATYQFWYSSWPGAIALRLGVGSRWAEFDSAYYARRFQLRRLADSVDPGAVLFVGDSVLAALDVGVLVDRGVQLSISGDTTRRVVSRLDNYPVALTGARLVVFHVGTNDLAYREPADLYRPFARMLKEVPAKVPVVMSAVLPVDERVMDRYGNADVRAVNRVMAQACAARPGCTFADAGVAVTDAAGGLDPRYHTGDGLHLNGAGNRAWRAALAPALAPWRDG